ncbi:MAG: type II toxin-antitoxin system PemK/MazF family toxin [Treponema sp.]|nr:type II toxin-antitoxin system PemK/MazF family toxin [Treponema sp.]
MRRGELYLVERAARNDTKKQRVFLVVSRQSLIDSSYSTVICAPVYTSYSDVNSQVELGTTEGLKHQSFARCDELMSVRKSELTNYVGCLSPAKLQELNQALLVALALD